MDLQTMTDIQELKVFKADQYDELELHQRGVQIASQNIQLINARIAELQSAETEKTASKSVAAKKS